jgi:hypothetical protein
MKRADFTGATRSLGAGPPLEVTRTAFVAGLAAKDRNQWRWAEVGQESEGISALDRCSKRRKHGGGAKAI